MNFEFLPTIAECKAIWLSRVSSLGLRGHQQDKTSDRPLIRTKGTGWPTWVQICTKSTQKSTLHYPKPKSNPIYINATVYKRCCSYNDVISQTHGEITVSRERPTYCTCTCTQVYKYVYSRASLCLQQKRIQRAGHKYREKHRQVNKQVYKTKRTAR